LADLDPDVDALFRLIYGKRIGKIKFQKKDPISYPKGLMTPFNTQNTIVHKSAFWGTFLPITTTFRVCDIWRGYWFQRILWEIGAELCFLPATAVQIRNPHDYLEDFEDEMQFYLQAGKFISFLNQWECNASHLFDRILDLAKKMFENNFWGEGDYKLTKAWLEDLTRLGYEPPHPI